MGYQYLLESNYSCLWKHVENHLFLSNFMKISSPSLNIFFNLFYFRGFFPTLSSSLEYSFFTLSIQLKVENIENANNTHIKQKQKTTNKRSYFSMSANFATME
jgi:hypothetical protein